MKIRSFALCLIALTAACGDAGSRGAAGAKGGTLVISIGSDADGFLPAVTISGVSANVEMQLFEKLAEVGMGLNTVGDVGFTPVLATGWTWAPDSLSIAFHIDPKARWHDGPPVTANDVRFTWLLYSDSATGSLVRPLLKSIDSVTVRDSLTPVFWFSHRSPEQFLDAAWQMRILPQHVLGSVPHGEIKNAAFLRNPVGSGPFKFSRWDAGQAIVLDANTSYHLGRPHADRVIFSIAPDPSATVMRIWTGDADFVEYLRPTDMPELVNHPNVRALPYPILNTGVVMFNERDRKDRNEPNAMFSDRETRRALSMAVDRVAIVRSVFDSFATVGAGPLSKAYPTYDPSIPLPPYSVDSAKRILDARGWKETASGVREKNGRPLAFTVIVPSSSTPRRHMAELMQNYMKAVGAKMDVEVVDPPTHIARMKKGDFDVSIMLIGLDPSPANVRESWGSASAGNGGSNYSYYQSKAFDAYVDTAVAQMDPVKAKAYFRKAYLTIIADAPAIWLYEPDGIAATAKRLQTAGIRADAWAMNIKDWSIAAGKP
jgi:peptide/nickel transport system substrate-binding protein